ncbi:MAG TPA: hypothetical protein VIV66_22250 [Pyrinomonadaceae bacterium]
MKMPPACPGEFHVSCYGLTPFSFLSPQARRIREIGSIWFGKLRPAPGAKTKWCNFTSGDRETPPGKPGASGTAAI